MAREIPLTKGYVTLVDDADFEWLSQWKWFVHIDTRGWKCAQRKRDKVEPGSTAHIVMHRAILGVAHLRGRFTVDHINHDTLDNRRDNLRLCTSRENSRNRLLNRNSTSGYKGVSWRVRERRWQAYIKTGGKLRGLGYFAVKEEAARAYDAAAVEAFGEFAYLNFPDEQVAS